MGRNYNPHEVMQPGALQWCEAEQKARLFAYFKPDYRYRCRTCGHTYVDDETFAHFSSLRGKLSGASP